MEKRVLYIQYTNPTAYPPLEHSSKILAEDGWQVRFVAIRARGDSNTLQFAHDANIELRFMSYCPPGFWQKIHYFRYVIWSLWQCLTFWPAVVYASDAWSYPIGYILTYLPGVEVVMHEHDTPQCNGSTIMRLIGVFRKSLCKRALICICPQRERASLMKDTLQPRSLQVVFNCPSRTELLTRTTTVDNELRLWFHGSIVPTQLPRVLLDAMGQCDFPVRLSFAGYETIGHPGYVQELLDRAEEIGLSEKVTYVGAIPTRVDMYKQASQNHVGLALFSMNFREPMVGASNKPFDYLACGLALLASETPEWKSFFIDRGCGLGCNSEDPRSIAQALTQFWTDRKRLERFAKNAELLLGAEWNYEAQFGPVLEKMNAAGK